ncbi:unnamed protein product [Cuscuta epithymum]|uniref:Protein kinase domain-containing protein n=1 Tax=Cuscuta epithymum TaxID=186058 RepID=A0AAV0G7J7_9ASTE|nr:unnamed protein product [Cuscuta epithymum]
MGMWGMLRLLSFLLKIFAIASSSLPLASSGHSLPPSSAAIPAISNGAPSETVSPTTSSSPNGKSVNPPPSALLPFQTDIAPQTMRGSAMSVQPSGPTTVPPNDISPRLMTRQDIVPSPPMNSNGLVQVSPLSGPQSKPPRTNYPVVAPESPVQDGFPIKKSPPSAPAMQPNVPPNRHESGTPDTPLPIPIAPAPVEPTVRELPPTMPPVVIGSVPPRPGEKESPEISLPMPAPIAPVEPPSVIPPIRQPVGIVSSPLPTPNQHRPLDTPITVPIAPVAATAEPPLREPLSPPTLQPVVTGSLSPTPNGNRIPYNPAPISIPPIPAEEPLRRSPPAMPPIVKGSIPPSPRDNRTNYTPHSMLIAPVPAEEPLRKYSPAMPPVMEGSTPPSPRENRTANASRSMPIAPGTSSTEHLRKQKNTPSYPSVNPAVSPSTPADMPTPIASPPSKLLAYPTPDHQRLPEEPPFSSPVKHDASTPLPSINGERVAGPIAAPPYRMSNHDMNTHASPSKAPSTHKISRHSQRHPLVKENVTAAPPSHSVPPPSSITQGPLIAPMTSFHSNSDPKSTLRHHISHPPLSSGPLPSNKISPSWSSATNPKMLFPHPFVFPPPPPNEDCSLLICMEPFTAPPPRSSCVCALPMQIELSLSVALYTFFPLVSKLAYEIASGVSMDPSQVRIMGANAANHYPEKTVVFIDLVPLGGQFDNTTAFLTFQNFWHKNVFINASFFGDYDVLYVRYPGLPPSPPSAPSNVGIIGSDPYSGDNARSIHPLGVDVSRKRHRGSSNRSLIGVIVLSACAALVLCCVAAWMLLFKHRDRVFQSDPTPPATVLSLPKSTGNAASVIGSRPNSPSLSFSLSFAAYTGSAKTFSLSEMERVTDNFNETRVVGEGGFGRVFSGALQDGTKVAVKVLKRDDHQGGREFLAEVEMLSRLHHRNVVQLIGICLEERARCLVYELVPNGSVESHLHGVDKESAPLDWNARVKIALGAARGLAYLHEDSSPRVIHRDFKSSNILLEHDFTPKVSDFGLARAAFDEENRHVSTRVMGTFGYVAPEYAMTGHLLVKSDVYSYGVVLLELLTGRKPVDMSLPPGQENLVSWARPFLTTKEGLEFIVDASLGPDFPVHSITKVAAIASMCVQPEVSNRPFMGEVVQALKLVCNETKDLESQNCDQENLEANDVEDHGSLNHLPARSPQSNSDCEVDLERGHSMSDLLSPSMRYEIHSGSGNLRTGRARRLWRNMRRLSGGSVSEHGFMFRLWPASN